MEIWKPVPGAEGYEVSDLGRVRSVDRVVVSSGGLRRRYRGRVLRLTLKRNGYLAAPLGSRGKALVHRLVLEAFIGPAPKGFESDHVDRDRANNRVENLRWLPRDANLSRRIAARGCGNGSAVLKARQVEQIRDLYRRQAFPVKELAARFKVSRKTIWKVGTGRAWGHIPS